MHELLSGLVGALFVLGSLYISFLIGRVRTCQVVNTNLLKERDGLHEANKLMQEANKQLLAREQAILTKPFCIHITPEMARDLAAQIGPYLAPASNLKVN